MLCILGKLNEDVSSLTSQVERYHHGVKMLPIKMVFNFSLLTDNCLTLSNILPMRDIIY